MIAPPAPPIKRGLRRADERGEMAVKAARKIWTALKRRPRLAAGLSAAGLALFAAGGAAAG